MSHLSVIGCGFTRFPACVHDGKDDKISITGGGETALLPRKPRGNKERAEHQKGGGEGSN